MKKILFILLVPFSLFANLVLYYSPSCPYSQKVLRYLQQTHQTVPMKNVYEKEVYKEELEKMGGKKQVPCLIIDGQPLYNADAIIQWLSEHPERLKT
jgi:glutaredoxin 3